MRRKICAARHSAPIDKGSALSELRSAVSREIANVAVDGSVAATELLRK